MIREEEYVLNKSELARRFSCDRRTVDKYLKDASTETKKPREISKATIRFDTSPGLQAQVDWKESITMINRQGEVFEINIFLMVLGYSRLIKHILKIA
ncbi:hypothetical protein [Paratissierella segnis]|jgi:transposase|uniref:hypothetical protein n=1 Tax=Paratissierella segnis TaxID=2763679 RepID=UPI00374474C4